MLFLAEWDLTSPELPVQEWWFFGVVLVLLIMSIAVVARLATAASEESDPAEIDRQMLTAVRELHTEGELTPEEYRSIKSQLVGRLSVPNDATDCDVSSAQVVGEKETEGRKPPATEEQSGEADSNHGIRTESQSPDSDQN